MDLRQALYITEAIQTTQKDLQPFVTKIQSFCMKNKLPQPNVILQIIPAEKWNKNKDYVLYYGKIIQINSDYAGALMGIKNEPTNLLALKIGYHLYELLKGTKVYNESIKKIPTDDASRFAYSFWALYMKSNGLNPTNAFTNKFFSFHKKYIPTIKEYIKNPNILAEMPNK